MAGPVETWYRFEPEPTTSTSITEWDDTAIWFGMPSLVLRTYPVVGRTAKGVWLDTGFGTRKWVSSTARKRFAYPTEEQALQSFAARRSRYIERLERQLEESAHLMRGVAERCTDWPGKDKIMCYVGTPKTERSMLAELWSTND